MAAVWRINGREQKQKQEAAMMIQVGDSGG